MKTVIAIFSLAAMLLLGAAISHAQQPASAPVPRAVLPVYSYDFGDINKGETLSFIFTIKNIGNADLHITDFVSDCGCETLSFDKVIAPGKEGQARAQIDTRDLSGHLFKRPVLRTNDPDQPRVELSLTANVLAGPGGFPIEGAVIRNGKHIGPIFLGPGEHTSLIAAAGQKARIAFEISAERGPVKVLRVESNNTAIVARVETVEEAKKYKIVVEPAATAAPGSHDTWLQVYTDNSLLPSLPVFVRMNVVAKM